MDFGLLVTKTYIHTYIHACITYCMYTRIHTFVFIQTLFCQVEAVGAAASQAFSDLKVQVLSATHAEVTNKDKKMEGEVSIYTHHTHTYSRK